MEFIRRVGYMKNRNTIVFKPAEQFISFLRLQERLKSFLAFSLAEMMVVMLIMSIILAAAAPIITTKAKNDKSANASPWKWTGANANGTDAFTLATRAMIGQRSAGVNDTGRFIITIPESGGGSTYSHLLFKRGNTELARFVMTNNNFILGNSIGNGQYNTSFGLNTLRNNNGNNNTAVGFNALSRNASGSNNIAIGDYALENNTISGANVAIGSGTLKASTAGPNIAIGYEAMLANTSGQKNLAIGHWTLRRNSTKSGNIAIGFESQREAAGSNNVSVGNETLKFSTGNYNTAVGLSNLYSNTSGDNNTGVGFKSLFSNTKGKFNTGIGSMALYSNGEGDSNTAIGFDSLSSNNSGSNNTAVGDNALSQNTSGSNNTAIGYNAGYHVTTQFNTIVGQSALLRNTGSGGFNTAVGSAAMSGASSSQAAYNTVVGASALNKAKGALHNVAIGYNAMTTSNDSNGDFNTAVGDSAMTSNTSGNNNTAIGYQACQYVTGSNVTCIGANSGPEKDSSLNSKSNIVYIGTASDTVYIPGNLVVARHARLGTNDQSEVFLRVSHGHGGGIGAGNGMYKVAFYDDGYFGSGSDAGSTWLSKNFSLYSDSDSRLKYVGQENKTGLEKIRQLKVFNYTFKKDPKKTPRVGVIAQDLQKVFPNAVKKGRDGYLQIRMEDMFYAVINAIKELDAKITSILNDNKKQDEVLKQVQNENKQLKQTLKQVQSDNKELKARLDKLEAKLK